MTLLLVCVLFAGNYINSNPGFSEEKTRVFPIPKVDDLRGIDTHLFFFSHDMLLVFLCGALGS